MTKKERLQIISDIIDNEIVSTQDDLTSILTKRGYNISQSTISRDIKELNLIKVDCGNKQYKYARPLQNHQEVPEQIISLFKQITTSIDIANNLVVVKTLVGNASSAGMAIDKMAFPGILGTISGDDTMLIIAKTNADAEIILKTLRTL